MSYSVAFMNRTDSQNRTVQAYTQKILSAKTNEEKEALRKEKRKYEDAIDEEHDLQLFLKEISGYDEFA